MDNQNLLTSSEELDNLQPGDSSVTVTLALVRWDPRRQRNNQPPRIRVLRGILSNFNGREVRVLFWEDRVTEFEGRIHHQILRISRPRVILANPAFADATQNLMTIEISIQTNTSVEILGPIANEPVPAVPAIPQVPLHATGTMLGPVRLIAYIRYQIARQVVNNFTFGSGAITDGVHHLVVNVAGFDGALSPLPGTHVSIAGELRRNNFDTLILQVADMNAIQVVDALVMPDADLRNGFRVPPRTPEGVAAAAAIITARAPLAVVIEPIHPGGAALRMNVIPAAEALRMPVAQAIPRDPPVPLAPAAQAIPRDPPVPLAQAAQAIPRDPPVPQVQQAMQFQQVLQAAQQLPAMEAALILQALKAAVPTFQMPEALPAVPAQVDEAAALEDGQVSRRSRPSSPRSAVSSPRGGASSSSSPTSSSSSPTSSPEKLGESILIEDSDDEVRVKRFRRRCSSSDEHDGPGAA